MKDMFSTTQYISLRSNKYNFSPNKTLYLSKSKPKLDFLISKQSLDLTGTNDVSTININNYYYSVLIQLQ